MMLLSIPASPRTSTLDFVLARSFPHMLVLLLVCALITLLPGSSASISPSFRVGHIHPLLHEQALSHFALHSFGIQHRLASFFKPRSLAIVGVEWGKDVRQFAQAGYHVYAVEPASKYIKHLNGLKGDYPSWNITVLPFAAGNESDTSMDLTYDNDNVSETVDVHRLEDHISESLAVLSVDVQGDELGVLQGAARLLQNVSSVWVEAIACNSRNSEMLELLDRHFTIFDFVPWGLPNSADPARVPTERSSFLFNRRRPSAFTDYLAWMCKSRESSFKWLQTDFLAIRTVLVDKVWDQLVTFAQDTCSLNDSECHLRHLLSDEMFTESKEEL